MGSMTLHVGMVATALNVQHLRGTGRYIKELLRNTRPEDGVTWSVYGNDPAQPMRVPAGLLGTTDVFSFRGDRLRLWEQLGLPLHVHQDRIQLLHSGENSLPVLQSVPSIVTIHDTILWEEPREGLDRHYWHDVQSLAYRRCAHVITISESSRRDIEARWPFLRERLTVIPHGIGPEFFDGSTASSPPELTRALGQAPYLLYMGGPQPRKRFGWATRLVAASGRSDLHLVACGFPDGMGGASEVPSELRGRVHFMPFIEDAELVALYSGARAVLYPTLYEGFGFPAVEAQAAGTPVLFSPISSLADLVGPLAWTPPPENFEAWRAALGEVLGLTEAARASLARQAIAWARRYSWRRSVEQHFELYREVLARWGRK